VSQPVRRRVCFLAWVAALVLALVAQAAAQSSGPALLDETYRIDILRIDVTFDYFPEQSAVDGQARVEFVMRPGQAIPRFHFPAAAQSPSAIRAIVLDGQPVPFPSAAVNIVAVGGSSQRIVQIERSLAPGIPHVLEMSYRLSRPPQYPRFSTEVNDMAGRGNEDLFPTLNTPHELARHRITLRVHGNRPFHAIGSGLFQRQATADPDLQQWVLDSEREVASYTLMFAVLPTADFDLQERIIHGIPVRILGRVGGPSIASAFGQLEEWLPRLEAAFGAYPAPRGLNVFLVTQGGGMEYFGGTITTAGALKHEVTHGYFACAVVMQTYRDSWLDEAITQWFTDISTGTTFQPISDDYSANWVGGRSPLSVGYSNLAYSDGARIIQSMANRLGGNNQMVAFLRQVYERHAFRPFTTQDFVLMFRDYSGIDLRTQFERWLYRGAAQSWERTTAATDVRRSTWQEPSPEGR
jgi:aminopeptidase N